MDTGVTGGEGLVLKRQLAGKPRAAAKKHARLRQESRRPRPALSRSIARIDRRALPLGGFWLSQD